MKKVVVYVRNRFTRPSDYYRFIQYSGELDCECKIRSAVPKKIDKLFLSNSMNSLLRLVLSVICYSFIVLNFYKGLFLDSFFKPDYIVVVREIFPRKIPVLAKSLLKKKVIKYNYIWDFDDSILDTEISKTEYNIYYEYAKKIVVSTPYLCNLLPKDIQAKASVLCTTDGDIYKYITETVQQNRLASYKYRVNVIWLATANNLPNLLGILEYLDEAAKIVKRRWNKELWLKVVCNAKVQKDLNFLNIENIEWTHDIAIQEILESHIGIMPLIDSKFARGKAGFKLIQYMSGGLPVIASDVGYNSSIVKKSFGFCIRQDNKDEWIDAILELCCDVGKWKCFSANAFWEWNNKYSYNSNLSFWNTLIQMN